MMAGELRNTRATVHGVPRLLTAVLLLVVLATGVRTQDTGIVSSSVPAQANTADVFSSAVSGEPEASRSVLTGGTGSRFPADPLGDNSALTITTDALTSLDAINSTGTISANLAGATPISSDLGQTSSVVVALYTQNVVSSSSTPNPASVLTQLNPPPHTSTLVPNSSAPLSHSLKAFSPVFPSVNHLDLDSSMMTSSTVDGEATEQILDEPGGTTIVTVVSAHEKVFMNSSFGMPGSDFPSTHYRTGVALSDVLETSLKTFGAHEPASVTNAGVAQVDQSSKELLFVVDTAAVGSNLQARSRDTSVTESSSQEASASQTVPGHLVFVRPYSDDRSTSEYPPTPDNSTFGHILFTSLLASQKGIAVSSSAAGDHQEIPSSEGSNNEPVPSHFSPGSSCSSVGDASAVFIASSSSNRVSSVGDASAVFIVSSSSNRVSSVGDASAVFIASSSSNRVTSQADIMVPTFSPLDFQEEPSILTGFLSTSPSAVMSVELTSPSQNRVSVAVTGTLYTDSITPVLTQDHPLSEGVVAPTFHSFDQTTGVVDFSSTLVLDPSKSLATTADAVFSSFDIEFSRSPNPVADTTTLISSTIRISDTYSESHSTAPAVSAKNSPEVSSGHVLESLPDSRLATSDTGLSLTSPAYLISVSEMSSASSAMLDVWATSSLALYGTESPERFSETHRVMSEDPSDSPSLQLITSGLETSLEAGSTLSDSSWESSGSHSPQVLISAALETSWKPYSGVPVTSSQSAPLQPTPTASSDVTSLLDGSVAITTSSKRPQASPVLSVSEHSGELTEPASSVASVSSTDLSVLFPGATMTSVLRPSSTLLPSSAELYSAAPIPGTLTFSSSGSMQSMSIIPVANGSVMTAGSLHVQTSSMQPPATSVSDLETLLITSMLGSPSDGTTTAFSSFRIELNTTSRPLYFSPSMLTESFLEVSVTESFHASSAQSNFSSVYFVTDTREIHSSSLLSAIGEVTREVPGTSTNISLAPTVTTTTNLFDGVSLPSATKTSSVQYLYSLTGFLPTETSLTLLEVLSEQSSSVTSSQISTLLTSTEPYVQSVNVTLLTQTTDLKDITSVFGKSVTLVTSSVIPSFPRSSEVSSAFVTASDLFAKEMSASALPSFSQTTHWSQSFAPSTTITPTLPFLEVFSTREVLLTSKAPPTESAGLVLPPLQDFSLNETSPISSPSPVVESPLNEILTTSDAVVAVSVPWSSFSSSEVSSFLPVSSSTKVAPSVLESSSSRQSWEVSLVSQMSTVSEAPPTFSTSASSASVTFLTTYLEFSQTEMERPASLHESLVQPTPGTQTSEDFSTSALISHSSLETSPSITQLPSGSLTFSSESSFQPSEKGAVSETLVTPSFSEVTSSRLDTQYSRQTETVFPTTPGTLSPQFSEISSTLKETEAASTPNLHSTVGAASSLEMFLTPSAVETASDTVTDSDIYSSVSSLRPDTVIYSTVSAVRPGTDIYNTVSSLRSDTGIYISVSTLLPDTDVYSSVSSLRPDTDVYSTVSSLRPDTDVYSSVSSLRPDTDVYSSVSSLRPDTDISSTVSSLRPDTDVYSSVSSLHPDTDVYSTVSSLRRDTDIYSTVSALRPDIDVYSSVSTLRPDTDIYSTVSSLRLDIDVYSSVSTLRPDTDIYSTVSSLRPNTDIYSSVSSLPPDTDIYSTVSSLRPDTDIYSSVSTLRPDTDIYSTVSSLRPDTDIYSSVSTLLLDTDIYSTVFSADSFTLPPSAESIKSHTVSVTSVSEIMTSSVFLSLSTGLSHGSSRLDTVTSTGESSSVDTPLVVSSAASSQVPVDSSQWTPASSETSVVVSTTLDSMSSQVPVDNSQWTPASSETSVVVSTTLDSMSSQVPVDNSQWTPASSETSVVVSTTLDSMSSQVPVDNSQWTPASSETSVVVSTTLDSMSSQVPVDNSQWTPASSETSVVVSTTLDSMSSQVPVDNSQWTPASSETSVVVSTTLDSMSSQVPVNNSQWTPASSETSVVVSTTLDSMSSQVPSTSAMPSSSMIPPSTSVTTTPPTTAATTSPVTSSPTTGTPAPDLLVITVIKLKSGDNVTSPVFVAAMEAGLAQAYQTAFGLQQAGGGAARRKRFASLWEIVVGAASDRRKRAVAGDVEVKMQSVQRQTSNPANANLTYTVSKSGQVLPGVQAAQTLNTLQDQEVALELGRVVVSIAEPAVQVQPQSADSGDDQKLWIIAAVLGPLLLLLVVWLVVCLLLRHFRQQRDKVRSDLNEPHLLTVKHGPEGEGTVSENQERPSSAQSNGLLKSTARKMIYEVNPYPDATPSETLLQKKGRRSLKKNKASSAMNGSFKEGSHAHTAEEAGSTVRRNTVKERNIKETEEMEMGPIEPPLQSMQGMELSASNTFSPFQAQTSFQDDEESADYAEEERKRNKQRQRLKKKQEMEAGMTADPSDTQAAYERAQKEIDKVLGPRDTKSTPDIIAGSDKKRSKRRSKKGEVNPAYEQEENTSSGKNVQPALPPPESLEEVKSRIYSVLDDAFSLLSNSYASAGANDRNRVAPAASYSEDTSTTAGQDTLKAPDDRRKAPSSDRNVSGEGKSSDGERAFDPKPEEILHTPLYVDRTYGSYDPEGLISWNPYRTSEQSARIVLPNTTPSTTTVAPQEKLITTTFASEVGAAQDNSLATKPIRPTIRARQQSAASDPPRRNNSSEKGVISARVATHRDGRQPVPDSEGAVSVSYPGMESYQNIPIPETTSIGTVYHTSKENSTGTVYPTSKENSISRTGDYNIFAAASSSETGLPDTPVPSHQPPLRNVGDKDEMDLITASLAPGASPKELVDSIRQDLQMITGKLAAKELSSQQKPEISSNGTPPVRKPRRASYKHDQVPEIQWNFS